MSDGKLDSFKLRSNPASPASVILEGLRRIAAKRAEVVHGSTVATNALLERKGAKTAFVTTRGFEDLIAIGRQNRPELYNLMPALPKPLVPREFCFGVDERVLFDGSVERACSTCGDLARRIAESGAESVAICLLHSYQNDVHERALLGALNGFVCASCDISPEFREFERASTTVINAYVGPLMDRYLGELEREKSPAQSRDHAIERRLADCFGGAQTRGADDSLRACGRNRRRCRDRAALRIQEGSDVRYGRHVDGCGARRRSEPRLTTEAPHR